MRYQSLIWIPIYWALAAGCGNAEHESRYRNSSQLSQSEFLSYSRSFDSSASTSEYYSAAQGKSGQSLKDALHQIISNGSVQLTYNEVWDALKIVDQDPNNPNNVIGFYTRASFGKNSGIWNREHVWAKSHGFPRSNMRAYTDIMHLRACETAVNSRRGNTNFADLPNDSGLEVDIAKGNYLDPEAGLWEPADSVKGDVARILFYMDARYQGDSPTEPDLIVVEDMPQGSKNGVDSEGNGYFGRLSDLLKWNKLDPVDDQERKRNEGVFEIQRNRNPFVDHPEYVDAIYGAQ